MKEMAVLVIISVLAAALTASVIRASLTYDVELVSSPSGPVVTAPAGEPFNVSCRALGGNKSEILMQWLDSKENAVGVGIPGVVKDENNSLLLTFTHPKSEDSGTYKCTAVYDKEQKLQYAVDIVFYGPEPEFEKDFENMMVTEGQRLEVYCSAKGERPITYEWYNEAGDGIIDMGKSIFVSSDSDGLWLIFEEAKLHHKGMYTCRASNSHGLSSKLYYIAVSPKPGNDSDNGTSFFQDISVVNVSANSVQFRIVVSGFAEGIEVMSSERRGASDYRESFTLAPDDIYSFEDLTPSGSYVFQFRILPLKSNSEWSKTFEVILLPDVPEIIIRRVEKSSIEFEWFRKVDDIMRGTIDKYEIKYYTLQMQRGNYWIPSTCVITIEKPSCSSSSHTISGLQERVYYQIEVRAHTEFGYGAPATQRIYIPG